MKRLAGYIAAALAEILPAGPSQKKRLTPQELEQRRAAARKSVASRSEKAERAKKRKIQRLRSTEPERKSTAETITSTESVPTEPTESGAPITTQVFLRYAAAFKLRYGTFPIRNAKISSMIVQFCKRVPHAEAPEIAAYYLTDESGLYTRASHCVDLLLRDAEGIRAAWATGRKTVVKVNGSHTTTVSKPWWEVWSGLKEQGNELGIEEGDNPTTYRFEVLRAAFKAGRLPDEIAVKLGVGDAGAS